MPKAGFCRILFYIFDIINIFELHNYLQTLEIVVPLPFFDSSGDDRALLHDQFMKRPLSIPCKSSAVNCLEFREILAKWDVFFVLTKKRV